MAGSLLPPVVATFLANTTDLSAKLATARTDLKATATEADTAAAEVEASSAKSSSASGAALSKMSGAVKLAVAGAAVGVAAIGFEAIKSATAYDTLTTQLVTGAGESADKIKMVSDGLLKMAPAVGIGPDALAKSMFTVESAGFHAADGLTVMKAAAEGAKIGGADATVVANGLTTAMVDYAIPASQAAATTSKLVETVASGKTTMQDLSGSLSNVLPSAKAAGVGLDQVLGAMATMTGEGISAQQASQDLAGTIRSLQAPSEAQTAAMQALGLNSLTVAQNLGKNGLTGTMDTLVQAITQHMGPAGTVIEDTFKKSQTAAADAKTELAAMPASMQKIATSFMNGQLTSTQWRTALKGMTTDQKQLAQQFAATIQRGQGFNDLIKTGGPDAETFSAALAGVTGGATGMNTALALTGTNAATFANNVKNISGATTDAKGNVQGWSETTKDFGFQVDQAKAGLQAMFITIGEKLIPIITQVIKVGVQWANWAKEHKGLILAVAAGIVAVFVPAIYAWASAMAIAAAETLIAAAPIIALVAAAALLAAGIYELYEHWTTVWSAIKSAAEAAKNFIIGIFNDIWGFLKQWGPLILVAVAPFIGLPLLIYQHWSAVSGFFSALWNDVVGFFKAAWDLIETVFMAPMKAEVKVAESVWSSAWSGIKSVVSGAKDVILDVWNAIKTLAIEPLKLEAQGLEDVWHAVWNGMGNAVKAVWDFIRPIINTIKDAVGGVTGAIGKITGGISSGLSAIGGIFADGGFVPGTGPVPIIAHGNEYVLSNAMLSGSQPVDPRVIAAIARGSAQATVSPATASVSGGMVSNTYNFTVQGSLLDQQGLQQAIVSSVQQLTNSHGPGFVNSVFSGQPTPSR